MLVPRHHWPVHPRGGKADWPTPHPYDPYDDGETGAERAARAARERAERERGEAERKRVLDAVQAMTRAVDLAGKPGVASGVAFVYPEPDTSIKDGRSTRDQVAFVVMARMADGRAVGGTAKIRDIPFDVALARVLSGHAATAKGRAGSFVDAVVLASMHLHADMAALAEDAVTRTCGEPCPAADKTPSWRDLDDEAHGTWLDRIKRRTGAPPPRYGKAATPASRNRRDARMAASNDLARGKALARAFLATLDPNAVALATTPSLTAGAVPTLRAMILPGAWEALDRTFGTGAPLATALRAHPGLPWCLVRHWVASPTRFTALAPDDAAREAAMAVGQIGAGDMPALGECLRDLAGADVPTLPRSLGRGDVDVAVRLVRCLSPLPANWRPRGTAGWLAFARCARAVAWAAAMNPGAPHLALGGGGDWEGLAARLGRIAGKAGIGVAVDGIGDLATALARQVVGPAMALAGAPPPDEDVNDDGEPLGGASWQSAALAVLASGRTVAKVLEVSARWHGLEASISAVAAGLPWPKGRPRGWPPAYPDLRMGGFSATVLTDDALLADEGRKGRNNDGTAGLGHCVGGYSDRCRQGACRILSIRSVAADGATRRVSTVELVRTDKGARASVRQHLGAGNHPPPKAAESFVERYVNLLNSGALDTALGDLQPCGDAGDTHLVAGYDYGAHGNWRTVADAWAPLLPRAARGMSSEALAAAVLAFRANATTDWSPDAFGQGAWRPAG